MAGPQPELPIRIQCRYSGFALETLERGPDGQTLIRGSINSFGGWSQFACTIGDLISFADLIYRAAGQQPRDVDQVVRVEHFAAAPPLEQLQRFASSAEPQDNEVAAIRKRMLEGR